MLRRIRVPDRVRQHPRDDAGRLGIGPVPYRRRLLRTGILAGGQRRRSGIHLRRIHTTARSFQSPGERTSEMSAAVLLPIDRDASSLDSGSRSLSQLNQAKPHATRIP
ncbi:hypothetical protein AMK29_19255 [Streptomyces sp. CB02261]|nr:hypothetical protein AMK29_19255 [Streptomyces sp. CB02261]